MESHTSAFDRARSPREVPADVVETCMGKMVGSYVDDVVRMGFDLARGATGDAGGVNEVGAASGTYGWCVN